MSEVVSLAKAGNIARTQRQKDNWTPMVFDLHDTWFPIAHSTHVGAKPVRRALHAQPVYVWREGAKALAAECLPEALKSAATPKSAFTCGTGIYPTVEQYGYVWVWYGNPDNKDVTLLPHIPFLPKDGVGIPNYMRTSVRFDGNSSLSVENLLDLTHADFLHGEVIGGEGEAESDEISFEYTSETLTRVRHVVGKPVSPVMRWLGGVRAKYQEFRSTLHVHLRSNVCISYPRFRPGFDIPNMQTFVPSGPFRSRVDQTFSLGAAPTPFRQLMPRMAYVVGPQDNFVVRPQNPCYMNSDDRADQNSRFDAPGVRYRFLMRKLWERQQAGDYSYLADADPGQDISALLGMDK
ncbi:oxygenase [Aestuariicella hydrocarbonica]|uniref:Oxygenase n=1 Tax=Pseudomaricurvus hydrocarbonicus TaxID=1470433 RepID=A0A9E5JTR7_9GAMM|nr:oxygenase [Aestuariicella hydrocarbonica]NHO66678.1 oxygenase [Aestuariicella hydrocarbonica]